LNEAFFFHWFLLFWTGLAVVVCLILLFLNAPYGRYARKGWGRTINPKWGWFLMESPSLFLPFVFFFSSSRPHRGLFRYVSSPNYLGEIVEWIGWGVATWSLPGAAFALWTIANLTPRALANHKWYKKTFPQYPSKRKALVPFIF